MEIVSGTLNGHAIASMILTAFALFLFSRERIPLETSSLFVVVLLTIGFTLFPYTSAEGVALSPTSFFSGFGHQALIAVCALMIVGHGLVRTGALEPVGRVLAKLWGYSPFLSLFVALVVAALLSAFVNNTPIVVLLLPILVTVASRTKTSVSGTLMPISFATILGGMLTTIGTSTNLLVVSVAADLGLEQIGMFDFFVPGLVMMGVGVLYLWLIAPRLLPTRGALVDDDSPRIFTAHIYIPEDSHCVDCTVREIIEKTDGNIQITRIRRSKQNYVFPLPDATVRAGDRLLVRDTPSKLKEYESLLSGKLFSSGKVVDEENPLTAPDQHMAELVVDRGSPLVRRTLNEIRFLHSYQVAVIAIHRKGRVLEEMPYGIAKVKLRLGDVLLIQGPGENIEDIRRSGQLLVLDATTELPHSHRAHRALWVMAAVIVVAALGILPIAISAVCGALLMMFTNCLTWRDVQRALSAQVVLIVVASLALGNALISTGATDWLASGFVKVAAYLPIHGLFAGLVLLMAILTNVVSNNAAAVIGTPIAISIAQQLGLPPEAFVLAVLFGANMSFATPMAYQTNLLVMNTGSYSFMDFVRVGVPLTVILWLTISWLLPQMYGF
ncbi:SLC13 family permease [Porticoccus sp. W117]|uniref:SLC13 family permease n=1 Tax=Porticoccus sp. W117 TaxID=3054777 RepID=UPI002591FA91|nr:SLC13 family permease [Porticoccus sp. W117]MDM3869921.1 SLC13 family permease [Porticoccus sp. W117]